MGTVSKVREFFHTPKRQAALTAQIEKLVPITRVTRLKSLCPTRWVQRHDALLVFVELLKPVLVTLQDIAVNWNDRESSSNAELLLSATQRSEFLVSLFVAEKVFSLSLPLSKYLQTINNDLSSAVQLAEDVLGATVSVRSSSTRIAGILGVSRGLPVRPAQGVLALCRHTSKMPECARIRHILKGISPVAFIALAVQNPKSIRDVIAIFSRWNNFNLYASSLQHSEHILPGAMASFLPPIQPLSASYNWAEA